MIWLVLLTIVLTPLIAMLHQWLSSKSHETPEKLRGRRLLSPDELPTSKHAMDESEDAADENP